MKKFDFRTAAVMLVVFALGYAIALAMPVARADIGDIMIVDRLVVTEYIEFANGPRIEGYSGQFFIKGTVFLHNGDQIYYDQYLQNLYANGFIAIDGIPVLSSVRELINVTIDPGVNGGSGLDVGKLGGYSAEDFILKSELLQCHNRTYLPLLINHD